MPDGTTAEAATRGTDWAALRNMAEDDIERIAAEDADNPATDESHWSGAPDGLSVVKT
ncbi:hypothetical protein [Methylorubrum sp. SB2]|uniref:hypothetical protein n=1 Tax=Methylorubrum subtropicum TaxID=3138812 RepID=UPI00313B7560